MEYAGLTDGESLSNTMKINLHMFGALMLNMIGGEVHSVDVIVVNESAPRKQTLKLMEQLAQLGGLSHVIGDARGTRLPHWTERRPSVAWPTMTQGCPEEHHVVVRRATSV
jgi:hypothetical protein